MCDILYTPKTNACAKLTITRTRRPDLTCVIYVYIYNAMAPVCLFRFALLSQVIQVQYHSVRPQRTKYGDPKNLLPLMLIQRIHVQMNWLVVDFRS